MLQGIARKKQVLALPKQVGQREVDCSNRTMEVDRSKQLSSDPQESDQSVQATVVDRKSRWRKEAVVQEPVKIVRLAAVARHIGVAQHEVEIINCVDSAQ